MKRLALFFALSAISMVAIARNAPPNPVEGPVLPASTTAQPASKDVVAKDDVSDRNCLKETGSRLAPRPDSKGRKCVNATGHAYTKDDLDKTGAIDLGDALRRLDPTVH